ncbi:MAG: SEL1-like repeat protein [Alphaproteobacteria bacterium]|nr:SEL1-like repeat protein [Alphaproteobacteria bacterium]
MTTKGAWYPKGVGPEARKAAREAAKRAGMPIGQWVESAILRHTRNTGSKDPQAPELALIAKGAPAEETGTDDRYAAAPPHRIHRQLRWLAGGSLVTLVFLIAGFGLFWIGQRDGPPPQITEAVPETEPGKAEDFSQATLNQIRGSAQAGDREAQFRLGMRYALGEWVPKDELAAADWFEKAALQGHPQAQYRLGLLYEEGRVVAQNLFEAFFWFQSAAEQGHLESKFKAGVAYAAGIGIGQDTKKAADLLRGAAEDGHAGAMTRLAELYAEGDGVDKDPEAAARWQAAASTATATTRAEPEQVQIVVLDKAPLDAQRLEAMERLLAGLGFTPGPIDGVVTNETQAAIRLYQSFAGLEADGQPSKPLLDELRAVSRSAGLPVN